MIVSISYIVVVLLGSAVVLLSVWGIVFPNRLTRMVQGVVEQTWGIYLAAVVRIVLGLALIFTAPVSKFPPVFQVLGWIAITAAIALLVIGRTRMSAVIAWFERVRPAWTRGWLILGLVFGGFLVYSVY